MDGQKGGHPKRSGSPYICRARTVIELRAMRDRGGTRSEAENIEDNVFNHSSPTPYIYRTTRPEAKPPMRDSTLLP